MADINANPAENSKVPSLDSLANPKEFPYTQADKDRLDEYEYYQQLLKGDHFEAFKVKIRSGDFNKTYAKLRFVCVNFAGMISTLCSDFLFGEPVKVKAENPEVQAWLEDLWAENKLNTLLSEMALDSSSFGDILFKVRLAKRYPKDSALFPFIESAPPTIYFPHIDQFNVSAPAQVRELAWKFTVGDKEYLRREIHSPGLIENKVYLMKGPKIEKEVGIDVLGIEGLANAQKTQIDRHTLHHTVNWKTSTRHFGYSDYNDLDALFFAISNRFSKVDNVLDKHTDPLLMVPPGVIDPKTGKVKRDGRVIEMGEGEDGKPEYIVWDASLENAFNQIDRLLEVFWIVSGISPAVFGLSKGGAVESGRALKYKLLRTLAKVNRKKNYYHENIRETLYVAQLLAKAWGAEVRGKRFTWEPEVPELVWQDGLPADEKEVVETESQAIDAGIQTQKNAIMKVHQVDEKTAEEMIKEIKKEKEAKMPAPLSPDRNPFLAGKGGKNNDGKGTDKNTPNPKARLPGKPSS